MTLEVCVDSYESILNAKNAGADRIELCGALNVGGLTPSYGLLNQAKEIDGMEIFVMIRPRSGDFLYSEYELETIRRDIEMVKEMQFDGIVIGFLKENGELDLVRLKEILTLAAPLKVVLHRAFDSAREPENSINALIEMGICRILTSGQCEKAVEGVKYIKGIQEKYGDKITIMPGSGVTHENIEYLYRETGCTHFHLSGKIDVGSGMKYKKEKRENLIRISEEAVEKTDYKKVNQARLMLDKLSTERNYENNQG